MSHLQLNTSRLGNFLEAELIGQLPAPIARRINQDRVHGGARLPMGKRCRSVGQLMMPALLALPRDLSKVCGLVYQSQNGRKRRSENREALHFGTCTPCIRWNQYKDNGLQPVSRYGAMTPQGLSLASLAHLEVIALTCELAYQRVRRTMYPLLVLFAARKSVRYLDVQQTRRSISDTQVIRLVASSSKARCFLR